jgi:glucosylceramidase
MTDSLFYKILLPCLGLFALLSCRTSSDRNEIELYLTSADRSALLLKSDSAFSFSAGPGPAPAIEVDSTRRYQSLLGFGYTLTGGSALLLHRMPEAERRALLEELFGPVGIGVSCLRLSLGASDLSESVFSYCDQPPCAGDTLLKGFSLAVDTLHLVPVLKEILRVNPGITLMASPWSAPTWMKSNGSSVGGSLMPQYYRAYARYFVQYIRQMEALGIRIRAVTVQNEPEHGGNNPSMRMTAAEQAEFIKHHLGPAFAAEGLDTRIVIWDHNCDHPEWPLAVLDDPEAKRYVDGTAFHLYAGGIEALGEVQARHPDRHLYFTEQWTGARGSFDGDFLWHMKNVVIGSLNYWSRMTLEWNLANDPHYGPHTPGGCTECLGALTIDGATVTRNVSYYVIAQTARHLPPGSVRIGSRTPPHLPSVAFRRPDGKIALLVLNESEEEARFSIRCGGMSAPVSLPRRSAGTFVW